MNVTELVISATDGYGLKAILRKPIGVSNGMVQIHCGTGIPQKLYANFASFLSENGYTTLTFDYRGIGMSKPKSLKGFEAHIRDWGQKDITGVFDWVLKNYPDERKIVIGHSMGGQMVGFMKNNHKIDHLILIASSTGYWKDMSNPFRWLLPPFWFLWIPLSISLYGYANAKKIRQGEDLPKGVAEEWKKWCIHPNYFEAEFGKTLNLIYFNQVKIPIHSIQITDDPIANQTTCKKLLEYYKNSKVTIERINPKKYRVSKIGHSGYFSRKFKNSLWTNLLAQLNKA